MTLGKVLYNFDSRRIPLSRRERETRRGPYPYYGAAGIIDHVDQPLFSGLHLLIGEDGSVVRDDGTPVTQLVDGEFWVNNHAHVLRGKSDSETCYVYYALRTININPWVTGAVQPKLNQRNLNQIPIPFPTRVVREQIVEVLGALDDKIAQNRQTARALDSLARAIFEEWLVNFEPAKAKACGATQFPNMPQDIFDSLPAQLTESHIGPVPEDWEVRPIAEVVSFLNGLALQRYPPRHDGSDLPVIKIAQLRKGSVEGSDSANCDVPSKYIVNDRDLLFSWSGTLEAVQWFGGKGALNQHLFKVTSSYFPRWYCLLWVRQHMPWFRTIAASKATTMGHIKRSHLQEAQVIVPTPNTLRMVDSYIGRLYKLYEQSMIEISSLQNLHRALLPKLISGEVSPNIT